MKKMSGEDESLSQYILKNLPKNSTIGMDFSLFTQETAISMKKKLKDYIFIDDVYNIIDDIWGTLKPKYNVNKVIILPVVYTGKDVFQKYTKIDSILQDIIKSNKKFENIKNYQMLISRLDDIAWFLNLRGNDIPYNPVFFSYALFCRTEEGFCTKLFVNKDKFDTPEIKKYCEENKIILFDYKNVFDELGNTSNDSILFLDMESTNHRMHQKIIEMNKVNIHFLDYDIIEDVKSVKNEVEIEGYKKANLKDSIALIKFFSWLEEKLVTKNRTDLNEYQIGIKNKQVREDQENYMGESFAPICAAGPNAAIIHYEQNENLHIDVNKNLILLCDTGGQYLDGTTDITRTVHYGQPTEKEKEMYTRVLLGNLSLERLIFEKGKNSEQIDNVPRSYLKMVGKDYLHGTSHGVGHFLNVHEGPYYKTLKEGNVITNEPGYYEENNFGIRIENEVLIVKKDEGYLGFENLTFIPYERNLIDMSLVNKDFRDYIDNFHQKCYDKLSPFLKDDQKALDYLKRKTQPL